jgi:hypothetical protein
MAIVVAVTVAISVSSASCCCHGENSKSFTQGGPAWDRLTRIVTHLFEVSNSCLLAGSSRPDTTLSSLAGVPHCHMVHQQADSPRRMFKIL